jgi:hypothetical protein
MKKKKKQTNLPQTNPPNIAFVGDKPAKPLIYINAPGQSFKLPDDQTKPFYHEEAGFLCRTFPHLYKPVLAKKGA